MFDPESCLCFIPDNVPLTLPTSHDHIREVNWFTGASETKKGNGHSFVSDKEESGYVEEEMSRILGECQCIFAC